MGNKVNKDSEAEMRIETGTDWVGSCLHIGWEFAPSIILNPLVYGARASRLARLAICLLARLSPLILLCIPYTTFVDTTFNIGIGGFSIFLSAIFSV